MTNDPKTQDNPKGVDSVEPKVQDPKTEPPKAEPEKSEDLTGLKNKRDELLGENRKLKDKLKKFEDQKLAEEKKKLEEEGKLKELLELQKKENEELKNSITLDKRDRNLKDALRSKGFNPKFAKLLDDVKFDENNQVIDIDNIIETAKKEIPEAFTEIKKPSVSTGLPPKGYNPERIFTREDIANMSGEEFSKNAEEISRQEKANLIK